jgi:hypothetical protein
MFIVRARFTLADGTPFVGYLTPSDDPNDFGTIQPQIITERGQVGFWMGVILDDIAPLYERLGKSAVQTFPVSFESDFPIVSGPLKGSIPAFLHLEGLKSPPFGMIGRRMHFEQEASEGTETESFLCFFRLPPVVVARGQVTKGSSRQFGHPEGGALDALSQVNSEGLEVLVQYLLDLQIGIHCAGTVELRQAPPEPQAV